MPPRLALWLLKVLVPMDQYDPAVGDLLEEFSDRAKDSELTTARRWFWRQTWKTTGHFSLVRSVKRQSRREPQSWARSASALRGAAGELGNAGDSGGVQPLFLCQCACILVLFQHTDSEHFDSAVDWLAHLDDLERPQYSSAADCVDGQHCAIGRRNC